MDVDTLLNKAIEAGKVGSLDIYDYYDQLDKYLGTDSFSSNVRNFFDSWSDAIGHDYKPYSEKDLHEWINAAEEIQVHFTSKMPLSKRDIWRECAVNDA